MRNLFCKNSDIKNEATVESFFVDRLLTHLGYADEDISLKESISEFAIGKGSKKILYKPDYILKIEGIPIVVIDAKSPETSIDKWEHQCSSYCLEINKEFDYNPVEYYMLSNGFKTSLYKWDKKNPLISLDFEDFVKDSNLFKELIGFISKDNARNISNELKEELATKIFFFEKVSLEDLSRTFLKLHKEIWQSEKKGPSAAFQELIKVFFVKIKKDREIYDKIGVNPKPLYKDVCFSTNWISTQTESANPINDLLFKNLQDILERDIISGKKKRFFQKVDQINISAETLKRIVKEIENIDLYGMEEDIHGRMFEAFLNATVRGKDLGQFFTPRDIVDLMVGIGNPKATKLHVDKILDACCCVI